MSREVELQSQVEALQREIINLRADCEFKLDDLRDRTIGKYTNQRRWLETALDAVETTPDYRFHALLTERLEITIESIDAQLEKLRQEIEQSREYRARR